MRRNYKISLLVLLLLLVFFVSLSFSYSSYNQKNTTSDKTVILADEFLSVNYLDGNYYDENFFAKEETIVKKISITNVSSSDTFFTIAIMDVNKQSDNFSLRLTDSNNQELFNSILGNIDTDILKTASIKSGETKTYYLYLSNNGEDDNYGITANIMVYKEQVKKETTNFKDTILLNNQVLSEGNNGLFKTNDNDGDTYYFRGNVSNNYVKIGDSIWRILRINGDGSVRLILNNVISDKATFVSSINMEDKFSNLLFSNTNAYKTLNTWLNANLLEYIDYLSKESLCSESTISYSEGDTDYISSYSRVITDNNPTLNCLGTIEKLNIGLISLDEAVYAGLNPLEFNLDNYLTLANIDDSWWTLSGSIVLNNSNVIDNFAISNQGKLTYQNKLTNYLYLRPVISLDKNVTVTGDGTSNNPYLI